MSLVYSAKIVPLIERRVLIQARLETSVEYGEPIYDFRGDAYKPKVIKLPIDTPTYRLDSCRTFSSQQTLIAQNKLEANFFAKGQENTSAQNKQHEILVDHARKGTDTVVPIYDVLQQDGQRETILISSSGVVINGNRRLAAMRELFRQVDGSIDSRFEYVKCSVLPPDTTRDEIDDIEADLQARPESKLDYDWIGDAKLIRRQIEKGRTSKEVADRLRRKKSDIENALQSLGEADLYLSQWLNKPGEYLLVQDGEQIFGDIPKRIMKQESNLQNASRVIAWSIFKNRNKITGRVYSLNRAFGDLAPRTLELLEDRLNSKVREKENSTNTNSTTESDEFEVEISTNQDTNDYTDLVTVLSDGKDDDEVIYALVDACETAIELEREQKSERAVLQILSQVNTKVSSIDPTSAGEQTLPAMLNQIKSIRHALDKIEINVTKRMESMKNVVISKE